MVLRAALCLWVLSLHLLWDNTPHVEASTIKMRKRQKKKRKLFKSIENRNGGVINKPKGFLCLRAHMIASSRGLQDEGGEVRSFSCAHVSEDAEQYSTFDLEGYDAEFIKQFVAKVTSGEALFMKKARLENGELVNIPTKTKKFKWGKMKYNALKDMLLDKMNNAAARSSSTTNTALAFFLTSDGVTVSGTPEKMSTALFGNTESTKSQYRDCSGNKFILNPAGGHPNIINGVVEITINPDSTNHAVISNTAIKAATQMGIDTTKYDHLMFPIPDPIPAGWPAQADIDGRISWFRHYGSDPDNFIYSTSMTVHELGHNLGLDHSNENGEEYEDLTCMMGISGWDKSCFNGAKLNQLGWHKDKERSVNPTQTSFSGNIIGINDIASSSSDDVLVLEIIDGNDTRDNLFVNYNKREGINQNGEYYNQIIVTQKDYANSPSPKYPQSQLLYHIREGGSQTIPNFAGSNGLIISFKGVGARGNVDYASVTVQLEGGPVTPPTAPVSSPTAPVSSPTAPVSPPTPSIGSQSLQIRVGDGDKIQGFVFAIRAKNNLNIINFLIRMDTVKTEIKVYTKKGKEKSMLESDWGSSHHNFVGPGKGVNQNSNLGNFNCPVTIKTGSYQSFYILGNKKTMYGAKLTEKPPIPYKTDSYMEFSNTKTLVKAETTEKPAKTSAKYVWNGIVTYAADVSSSC